MAIAEQIRQGSGAAGAADVVGAAAPAIELPAAATAVLGDVGAAAAEVAERVQASVVEVRTRSGAGAGTIWRADGRIVTNHHVMWRDRAEVVLPGGRVLTATVEARDPRNDLAVLRVEASGLPAAEIGDARRLRPGELVLAVGHPFGVRRALTVGVVHQPLVASDGRRELVRADVLLGPGNSGGPLTDARGRVVGINAMVHGGLALAVPSHLASRLIERPEGPPVLGVAVQEVTLAPAQAKAAGRPGDDERGLLVVDVERGSAAEAAGVLLGDVLLTFGGQALGAVGALPAALAAHAGGVAPLVLVRGARVVEVGARPRPRERPN